MRSRTLAELDAFTKDQVPAAGHAWGEHEALLDATGAHVVDLDEVVAMHVANLVVVDDRRGVAPTNRNPIPPFQAKQRHALPAGHWYASGSSRASMGPGSP